MSMHRIEKITCPDCNAESEFLIWPSINTALDPEMKEKVRTGEAFQWVCPKCGCQANVDYATLYHQMEDNVMIYYVPGDPTEVIQLMKMDGDNPIKDIATQLDASYMKRVVCTRNQFREKLLILDEGLDDRVVELMKIFLIAQLEKDNPDMTIKEFLFDTVDGERCFAVNTGNDQWGEVNYVQDIYDMVCNDFRDILDDDDEVVIDMDWALAAIKGH